ncbi:THAP domain-containing protein 1-like isoform X2 [Maniola jurtina]|uniref:THAP domain-containing protein 1-like isoform X2 n=1 Tax=Maniola jurtina TaxID=191418 RepID=UPI001E68C939|nr:THAP domain-containing protein 1-like isoform X2 [Maniola jurtina]
MARFPTNLELRKKWINAIGVQNINPRHKYRSVCSRHFKESELNKTLNVMRLRDNIVPSLCLERSSLSTTSYLSEKDNDQELHEFGKTLPHSQNMSEDEDCSETRTANSSAYILIVKDNVQELHNYCIVGAPSQNINPDATQDAVNKRAEDQRNLEKIKQLTDKLLKQSRKIRTLNQKVNRGEKRIAALRKIIQQQRCLDQKVRRGNKKIEALSKIIEQLVPDKTDLELLLGDNCIAE